MKYGTTFLVKGEDYMIGIEASCQDVAYELARQMVGGNDYGDLHDIDWEITEISRDRKTDEYNAFVSVTGYVDVESEGGDHNEAAKNAFAEAAKLNYGSLEIKSMERQDTTPAA